MGTQASEGQRKHSPMPFPASCHWTSPGVGGEGREPGAAAGPFRRCAEQSGFQTLQPSPGTGVIQNPLGMPAPDRGLSVTAPETRGLCKASGHLAPGLPLGPWLI